MTKSPVRLRSVALALAGSSLAMAIPASAQAADPQFATFVPSDDPIEHTIDYSIWTDAMKALVISMGPSARETAGIPENSLGTRRQYGHDSRYRLEGSMVLFPFFNREIIESFTIYREDLESVAATLDIQSLSRNEQLAYWINLHNVALMEQLANQWPVRQPRDVRIDGVPLDDAKIITVEGVALSLKDIRTKIVYPNWKDPKVMYGFWRGEIGGPALQREAFNAENVGRLLEAGAIDFVNSLRGTQKLGDTLQVSENFLEAAPFYFPDFEADLRRHIDQYAGDEVKAILARTSQIDASISEHDIADIAGGVREPTYQNITSNGLAIDFRIPPSMNRLLVDRQIKNEKLIREGRFGTVIVNANPDEDGEVD